MGVENKDSGDSKLNDSLDLRSLICNIGSKLRNTCLSHMIILNNKLTEVRKILMGFLT